MKNNYIIVKPTEFGEWGKSYFNYRLFKERPKGKSCFQSLIFENHINDFLMTEKKHRKF